MLLYTMNVIMDATNNYLQITSREHNFNGENGSNYLLSVVDAGPDSNYMKREASKSDVQGNLNRDD